MAGCLGGDGSDGGDGGGASVAMVLGIVFQAYVGDVDAFDREMP